MKTFMEPTIEVREFDIMDVITVSGPTEPGDDDWGGGDMEI